VSKLYQISLVERKASSPRQNISQNITRSDIVRPQYYGEESGRGRRWVRQNKNRKIDGVSKGKNQGPKQEGGGGGVRTESPKTESYETSSFLNSIVLNPGTGRGKTGSVITYSINRITGIHSCTTRRLQGLSPPSTHHLQLDHIISSPISKTRLETSGAKPPHYA